MRAIIKYAFHYQVLCITKPSIYIMKTIFKPLMMACLFAAMSCNQTKQAEPEATDNSNTEQSVGQEGVVDDISNPNIVQVAVKSKDHTTLVAALKAAGLVTALSNAGPFTVFAPTNAAFDKLPAGTVEDLVKPENKQKLVTILGYHTYVGGLKTDYMQDGQTYEMVTPQKVTITKKDGKTYVNGSEIVASIETSNGIIHVINDVLLPK